MKIKRFFAPDIRQAMRMVREDQGPDAVILSNRRVDGGIEIMAATDYDEETINNYKLTAETVQVPAPVMKDSAPIADTGNARRTNQDVTTSEDPALTQMRQELKHLRSFLENQLVDLTWNDFNRRTPIQAELIKRLLILGVGAGISRQIAKEFTTAGDIEQAWVSAQAMLAKLLPVAEENILDAGGIVALVGPTGVGKTTTIAKLAARYAMRRGAKHVALITADNFRVGALVQLRTYGRLLDVSVRQVSNSNELGMALDDLSDKHLVLIDTAGMGQRDARIAEQFSILQCGRSQIKTYLVLAANTQLAGMDEVIRIYRDIPLSGCILSKLDESTSLGAAMSVAIAHSLPLAYVCDGQCVPEDIHIARSEDIVNRGVSIMQKAKLDMDEETMRFAVGRAVANA